VITPSGRRFLAAIGLALVAAGCGSSAPTQATPTTTPTASLAAASPSATPCITPPAPSGQAHWWDDRVFYEVFVRSFADSDGDGVGDLRGLIDHLDYLNDGDPTTSGDLGVTGIWLMPVAEAASYHGYDVVDYEAVERDYGTAADFRDLILAAHARGIAVVVDLILNHTSAQHPWFQDSRDKGSAHADWYIWSDTDPGYAGPQGQPVWYPDGDRVYYAQFWEGMPDLNLDSPEVTAALDYVARFWLQDLGVDGFRLDAIKHLVETGEDQVNTPATHACSKRSTMACAS
jgi:glycosidase